MELKWLETGKKTGVPMHVFVRDASSRQDAFVRRLHGPHSWQSCVKQLPTLYVYRNILTYA